MNANQRRIKFEEFQREFPIFSPSSPPSDSQLDTIIDYFKYFDKFQHISNHLLELRISVKIKEKTTDDIVEYINAIRNIFRNSDFEFLETPFKLDWLQIITIPLIIFILTIVSNEINKYRIDLPGLELNFNLIILLSILVFIGVSLFGFFLGRRSHRIK